MSSQLRILAISILFATVAFAQTMYEPLALAQKIFGREKFDEIDKYSTGEYTGSPNGQDLQKGAVTKFRLLEQTEKTAVVNMTILDSTGNGIDTYLHFEKHEVWKITAVRALALSGIIEQVKTHLQSMTPQQIEEVIEKSKNKKKNDYSMFNSREEYDFLLGNSTLLLELDDNIVQHFNKNEAEFERIKNIALEELESEKGDGEKSKILLEDFKQEYRKLFITSVSSGGFQFGNAIEFLIGGMVDNSVGYLYVKEEKDLPKMTSSRIIMIREIRNGWYMYKTT